MQQRDAQQPPQSTQVLSASDENLLIQAMDAIDRGEISKAETLLQALHSRAHRNFEINESLGLLYAKQGNLGVALPLLVDAAQERPDSDVAHANLGTAYFKLQHMQDAIQEFERAVHLNPMNASAQAALGQAWMLQEQPSKAILAFDAALKVDSSNPDLMYNAALAHFDDRQPAQAAALLTRMPGLSSSAAAQSLFGDSEENLGNYKEAAEHYARAATLDPSEANVYLLGVEFLRHWTFGAAIREFAAGVERFPETKRMHLGLAIAYYGNGNYDKAIPILADLLAAEPESALDAELLGRTCTVLTEGLNPKCAALIEFAERHPRNAALATYAASSILHKPSNAAGLQQARRLLQAAIAADPNLPQAQFETGVLAQIQSKWGESIVPLEAAVRLKPDYAQAHYRLARAYSHVGRHEEAQKQIALSQQYSKKEEDSLNARMKEITTLVVKMQ